MNNPTKTLSSARLILRLPEISDLYDFHRCFEDRDAMKYYIDGFSATIDETHDKLLHVLDHWKRHHCGDWVMIDKTTHEFIGFCGYDCDIDLAKPNLGFALIRKFWDKGFATEAVSMVIRDGFERLQFEEMRAFVHPENKGSLAVLAKCKMTFYNEIVRKGHSRLQYSLTSEDYLELCSEKLAKYE